MKFPSALQQRLQQKYGPWGLVTGASSGIGRELALRLAEAGLHVVLNARNENALNQLAEQIRQQYKVKARVAPADLAQPHGISQLLCQTEDLDIGLFIAAAGFGTSGPFLQANLATEINMLQVNCQAVLHLSHHFAQQFAARGGGGIVLLASLVGFQGTPLAAHYAATKAYVQSLAEALYVELRPEHVDVLAAAPGPVRSGFAQRANMQMGAALNPEDVGVPILKALGRQGTVLPGLLTKFLVGSLRLLPRRYKVRVMKKVMHGMTLQQAGQANGLKT